MKKTIMIVLIVMVFAGSMGFSGIASIADDAVRIVLKGFGDDMVKILGKYSDDVIKIFKNYGEEGAKVLKRYGDDAARAVSKYGDDAIRVFGQYGDEVSRLAKRYGDEVVKIASVYGDDGLKAVKKYGYNGITTITKYGDDGIRLIHQYGDDMARGLSVSKVPIDVVKRNPTHFVKISKEFANSPYRIKTIVDAAQKSVNEVRTLEIMANYGKRVFNFINKNKALFAGMTMVGAVALAANNPEVVSEVAPGFNKGIENITKKDSPLIRVLALGLALVILLPLTVKWLPKIIRITREFRNEAPSEEKNTVPQETIKKEG